VVGLVVRPVEPEQLEPGIQLLDRLGPQHQVVHSPDYAVRDGSGALGDLVVAAGRRERRSASVLTKACPMQATMGPTLPRTEALSYLGLHLKDTSVVSLSLRKPKISPAFQVS